MAIKLVSPCGCGRYEGCPYAEVKTSNTSEKHFIRDLAAYKLTHDGEDMSKLRVMQRGQTYTVEAFIKLKNIQLPTVTA